MAVNAIPHDEVVTTVETYPPIWKRISWQAILAGVVVALIVQFTLNMLGLTIGASSFDPLYDQDPLQIELATGTVIWMAASTLIALAAGGAVAGRMAGLADPTDAALQGLVTWAVFTLVSLLILTTVVGNIVGAAGSLVSSGINLAGQSVADVAPEVADALDLQDIRLQAIQEEARQTLNITDAEVAQAEETVENTAADIARQPSAAQRELELALNRLLRQEDPGEEVRSSVVNILVQESGMTEEEARTTVQNWEQTYRETVTQAEETAREVGQQLSDSVAVVAGLIFMVLVVGALAAGAGGILGSPQEVAVTTTEIDT